MARGPGRGREHRGRGHQHDGHDLPHLVGDQARGRGARDAAGRRRAAPPGRPRGQPAPGARRPPRAPRSRRPDRRHRPCGPADHRAGRARVPARARNGLRRAVPRHGPRRPAERGLPVGPPAPQQSPAPDEWMRVVGSVPLAAQPGARWLYNTGAQVLGVLVARAAGRPLPELLAERLLDPLGMVDTGFHVPPDRLGRFGRQWLGADVYDEVDGQWARPPAFPDAASGLVSTVADLHAFATSLRAAPQADMLTAQGGAHDEEGREGWGLGIGVLLADLPDGRHAGSYGWDGGLGSTWWTDPVTDTVAILLTTDAWTSPQPTPVFTDFWTAAFAR
nr:serine hydrolase domain-containing protein [Cellulomonas sp. Root137]